LGGLPRFFALVHSFEFVTFGARPRLRIDETGLFIVGGRPLGLFPSIPIIFGLVADGLLLLGTDLFFLIQELRAEDSG